MRFALRWGGTATRTTIPSPNGSIATPGSLSIGWRRETGTADGTEATIGIRKQLTDLDYPANTAYPTRLVLPEPIGARGLFDASAFPPGRGTTKDPV